MTEDRRIGLGGILIGIALAIFSLVVPLLFPNLPTWFLLGGLVAAFVIMAYGLCMVFAMHPWPSGVAFRRTIVAVSSDAIAPKLTPALITVLQVSPWLTAKLGKSKGIDHAYLFGSVVHPYASNDVDIALIMDDDDPSVLRKRWQSVRRIQKAFADEFGLPLHVTKFTQSESRHAVAFLAANTTRQLW